jgi:hypothetical protein
MCSGTNDLSTGFGFYVLSLAAQGVMTTAEHRDLVSGFNADIVFAQGLVYASTGEVVDVSDPNAPKRVGVFPYGGEVVPQPERGHVVMFANGSTPPFDTTPQIALRWLSTENFTVTGTLSLDGADLAAARNLVQLDAKTFAFIGRKDNATTESVFILKDAEPR